MRNVILILLCFVPFLACSQTTELPKADNADRVAVRNFLKENLDNPEWEEVRWWPAVEHAAYSFPYPKIRDEMTREEDIERIVGEYKAGKERDRA